MFASRRGVFFLSGRRARPEIAATLGLAAATAAFAAAAVYFLDPSSGKRRRAQMRDRMVHARDSVVHASRKAKRHLHAVADRAAL
jgi:hypothetical protein